MDADVRVLKFSEAIRCGDTYLPATSNGCAALEDNGPEARREHFLFVLRETGIVAEACRAVGVRSTGVMEWRRKDPRFSRRYEEALVIGRSAILDVAVDRALNGAFKPVTDGSGGIVGWTREPSDAVLIALLKRMFPDRLMEGRQ
jgi:hypothetical protein